MSETKFTKKDLFNGDLTVDLDSVQPSDEAIIGDKDYLFCSVDGALAHDDGKAKDRAEYMAIAANCHDDLVAALTTMKVLVRLKFGNLDEDVNKIIDDADRLLAKARGE